MTPILLILAVTAVVLLGALYARLSNRSHGLIGLYITFTIASQIIASKVALFDFGFIAVTAPAAVIIFAVTFLITDMVNERFGRAETHRMIAIALVCQAAFAGFLFIGGSLTPAPFWGNQPAWDAILGVVPRIMIASWITFLVSENLDAFLFARIRAATKGRHLWMRNVFSSAIALTVDTVMFVSLAFYGTDLPLVTLMVGQFVCKYAVALLNIPFMYLARAIMGRQPDQAATPVSM